MTKYYLYNELRYFKGSQDFPEGMRPQNGTITPPNNEPNQKWMGNEWKNVPQRQDTLDETKLKKNKEAAKFYNDVVNSSLTSMADFEPASWESQRTEWIRYVDDNLANTPYCDALAAARGITKEALMTKIGTKVTSIAAVQGTMHAKMDLIEAAVDFAGVQAVTFE